MSVTHICDSSYFSWPGTLHHVCWLLLVGYHNELIREQMPNDQKMKCEQWTPFLCWRSLSESQSEWPSWLGSYQQVGLSLPSQAEAYSCMRAKGHCSIRVQQQVIHVASCCARGLGACGGCLCAQMNFRGPGGRVNQSQLSSGASPLFEYSLLLLTTSSNVSRVQAAHILLCFDEIVHGGVQMAVWHFRAKIFINFLHDSGRSWHRDHQILPANHNVKSVKCFWLLALRSVCGFCQ